MKSFAPWSISIVAIVIASVAFFQTPPETPSENEVQRLRERVAVLEAVKAVDTGTIRSVVDAAEAKIRELDDLVGGVRTDLDTTAGYLDSVDGGMVEWSSDANGRITDVEDRVDAIEACVLSIANQLRQRRYDPNAC